jgi:hypothetical protein
MQVEHSDSAVWVSPIVALTEIDIEDPSKGDPSFFFKLIVTFTGCVGEALTN